VGLDDAAVGGLGLLGQDFDCGEIRREAGAVELVALLGVVTFGDQDAAVAGGEVGQGCGDFGQQFHLLVGDRLGEGDDAIMLLRGDRLGGELLETFHERPAEAFETISVRGDSSALAGVQVLANFFRGVDAVVEI